MSMSYGVSRTDKVVKAKPVRKATYMIPYPNLSPGSVIGPTFMKTSNPYGMICQKLNSNNLIHIDGFVFDHDAGPETGVDVSVEISLKYKSYSGGSSSLYIIGTVDLAQYASYATTEVGNPQTCVVVDKSFTLDGIPDVNTGFMVMLEQKGGTKSGNELNLQFGIY